MRPDNGAMGDARSWTRHPGLLTRGWAVALLAASSAWAEGSVPAIRIGILGDPTHQVSWNDSSVDSLKSVGFNEVQLNVAWGARPFGEPLNLSDVVTAPGDKELPGTAQNRAELARRLALAKQHGLRTMFTFGSPNANFNPYLGVDVSDGVGGGNYVVDDVTTDSWYDIQNGKTRTHELALLKELRRQFPDIDDILVYTYDNHAWQTPEFQYTKDSYGVPLGERLPGFLAALHQVWVDGRQGGARMWWEPWELSAGEVYDILPRLPRGDFGLIIHADIAEAQLALPVDVWFRNTARMARALGLPVIAESFFSSATEEIEPLSIPAPRLVDEAYLAFTHVPGIVGIKEYYGVNTESSDLDRDMLAARLRHPDSTTEELLADITRRFGDSQAQVRAYLEFLSEALQIYPWDASWSAREVGRASVDHGWSAATIQGAAWNTPSWQSTRRAKFMKTDASQPHFWMLEDVQLRCKLATELLDKASALGGDALRRLQTAQDQVMFRSIEHDVDRFRRVTRSYALHIRETNIAFLLRQDLQSGRPMTAALAKELAQCLGDDVLNQSGEGRVLEMRRLYLESPENFVRHYLLPADGTVLEKGMFTLTTR
jgi:hypothetical protein